MSFDIERSLIPAEDYISLIQLKYGNTPETKQFIRDTQHGLTFVSEIKSSQAVFFHARQDDRLIGHIALIPTAENEAFFGFFELTEDSCMHDLWQALVNEAAKTNISKLFGPINGSVWHPYRVISETNNEPFFLYEPVFAVNYNQLFQELKTHQNN